MAKISHTKIKQPSFGEKRPKLTYTKISRFTGYTQHANLYIYGRYAHLFVTLDCHSNKNVDIKFSALKVERLESQNI
jgi:hypothetical protein